ncbi:Beige/BEACH domain containing protein [Trichomonas vaginalis G3]|uniref:Beige/BEACH domain containing protein n=1 Tax=Trichomonas vaginalis (strain ATCC PRA-98 / G3) TaxID=412133 RepID=A2F923_TRIV3|nr:beige/BEACH-related family [Trichomonas vaginalis G3]EAX98598.1 Beige/BEACH domain containing protein [Trichomonas vaginalis G3]KAI5498387.1 beige/BEACH-related family [Trichomonas vaginalis G3]|eukprot:XP_001311528.1 Beige/BEACH domain containing protein [Trichomonas vaginalis G3]
MLRSLQLSFRQLRGINLSNRLHKLWVKYFTLQTPATISTLQKNHPLNGHYSNFNLSDINMKVLYTQADAIEMDPGTALPPLLNLDQPISPHYFKFAQYFITEQKNIKDNRVIVFEASAHLMRAFICFVYQTKEKIEMLNQGRDSAFLPTSFVNDFPYLIQVLMSLPSEYFSDFLYIWAQYQQYLIPLLPKLVKLDNKHSFTKALAEIFEIFNNYLSNTPEYLTESAELTSYVIAYFDASFKFNPDSSFILETFKSFCNTFSKNQNLRNIFPKEILKKYLELIIAIFNSIGKSDPKSDHQKHLNLVNTMFQVIQVLTPIPNDLLPATTGNFGIMTPIIEFLEWCSRIELQTDIIPKPCQLDPVYKTMKYPSNPFTFREESLISPILPIPKYGENAMSTIQPLYLEKSPILISILLKVATICGKSNKALSDFICGISKLLESTTSLKMQYISTVVLFSCTNASSFTQIMDQTGAWSSFITKTLFNKNTVLNDESPHIMQLKGMVQSMITRCFLAKVNDFTKLISAIVNILTADDPHNFNDIIIFMNKIVQVNPPVFIKSLLKTDLINCLLSTYFQYRELAALNLNDKIIRDCRSQIASFIFQIIDSYEVKEYIYRNDSLIEELLIFIFEKETYDKGLSILLSCLSTFKTHPLMRQLNVMLRTGLQQPMNSRWKQLIYDCFEKLTDAVHYNDESIAAFFPSSGCLNTFGLIPSIYADNESKVDSYKFVVKVLNLFIILFNKSQTFQINFSNPNAKVRQNMEKALNYIDIDETVVNCLLSLTTNSTTTLKTVSKFAELTCVDGLALLYFAVDGTVYHQPIIDFLSEVTENSISNRYQCFRSNIIQSFLTLIPHNNNPTTMKLFSQIGASYFRMNEVSLTIRLLKNVEEDYVLSLLSSMNKMTELYDKSIPRSFFHIGLEDPVFSIPPFQIQKKFTFSCEIFLEDDFNKNIKRTSFTLHLTSKNERLDLSIVEGILYLDITSKDKTKKIKLLDNLKYNVWFHLLITFEPKHITSYINYSQINRNELEDRFTFSDNIVYFSIRGQKVNIENITLFNSSLPNYLVSKLNELDDKTLSKWLILSKYSASQFNDNKCINSVTDGIVSASFNGLVVPFMISTVESIPTCGGPRIILPLFTLLDKNKNQQKFFLSLLRFTKNLASKNESLFVNQRFFRSLGHILLKMNKEFVTEQAIDELYEVYKHLHLLILKKEMIRYIWGDFAIWHDMSYELKLFMFTGVFTGLLQIDPQTFTDVIPFREFLTKFIILSEDDKSNDLIKRCWNFLFLLSQCRFESEDALSLYSSIISASNNFITLASIELLRNLLTENCQSLIEFFNANNFYHAFIQLLNSQYECTRVYGIHLLYYIHTKRKIYNLSNYDLSDVLIHGVRMFIHIDQTNLSLYITLGVMYGLLDFAQAPPMNYEFDFNKKSMKLKYPQFLPILECLLQQSDNSMISKISNLLINTFLNDDDSCYVTSEMNLWTFWLIFFSFRDKKFSEWTKVLSKVFSIKSIHHKDYDPTRDLTNIDIFCHSSNLNSTSIIRSMLMESIESSKSQKIVDYSLKFVFFVNIDDDDMLTFRKEKTFKPHEFDLLQTFAQKIILLNPDFDKGDLIYTRQTNSDPWPDFYLAIRIVRTICSMDNKIFNSPFISYNEIHISYATMCSLLIVYIYEQSRTDADPLIPVFCEKCKHSHNKEQLVNSLFILLDKYSYSCEESTILLDTLHFVDKFYQVATIETCNDITEGVVTNTINDIMRTIDIYKKNKSNFYHDQYSQVCSLMDSFFNEHQGDHFFYDMKQVYRSSIESIASDNARILRGNAKFWRDVMKNMNDQIGGPWGSDEDKREHFMAGNYLDPVGRRINMKINYHFNLHSDASLLRDNSLDEANNQKQIFVPQSQEKDETDEPNNRMNTVQIECRFITLAVNYTGTLFLGNNLVAFESSSAVSSIGMESLNKMKIIEINLDQISFILKRRYQHIDNSVEVFTTSHRSYFFFFYNDSARTNFMKQIKQMKPVNCRFIQFKDSMKFYHELSLFKKWSNGDISNYEYLYWLNILSGRSFHDLAQYPVFPWVIQDYKSEHIDLNDERIYRDLSLPIGALNKERLENLDFLYKETKGTPMAALYRFHYSTAAYVIGYLIRIEPFTSLHIDLQSGKFDYANRLFYSLDESWSSCVSKNADFRELIPELFTFPDCLLNSNKFDLGTLQDGGRVDDVVLPAWSKCASYFVAINRLALESSYVSTNLHKWIDLVFGYESRGLNAEKAHNNFHPYSYSSSITSEVLSDPSQLSFIQSHAANCGVVPDQLFQQPHQQRRFIPRISKLSISHKTFLFESKKLCTTEPSILRFSPLKDTIWVLTKFGDITQYMVPEMTVLQSMKVSLTVPSDIARLSFFEKHLVFRSNCMFFSTPFSTTCRYIDIIDKRCKEVNTFTAHSVAVTSVSMDNYNGDILAATSAGDSSLIVWNLNKFVEKCRIVAHTSPIVGVDINICSDIVCSIDYNGTIVLSSVTNGSFLHSYHLSETPSFVKISPLGFVVIVFHLHNESGDSTKLMVFDFGLRKVSEKIFEGKSTSFCMIELKDCSSYFAISFDTKYLYILNIFDLDVRCKGPVIDNVTELEYSKDDERLFVLLRNGDIYKFELFE